MKNTFIHWRCNLNQFILSYNKSKKIRKKKEELLNKQKQVELDIFYLVHYRVKENKKKLEGGLIGLYNNKYLAIKACELIENTLNDKYDDDDITVKVRYSTFILNHIKYI